MRWLLIVLGVLITMVMVVVVIGALLPREHVATVRVRLSAPPDTVFAVLSDPLSGTSWRSDLLAVEALSQAGGALRWREDTRMGAITMVMEEVSPPYRLVTRIDDPDQPFAGRWIHTLEPTSEHTILTIREEGEVFNPVFRFVSRFIFGHHATLERYAGDLAVLFGSAGGVERVR